MSNSVRPHRRQPTRLPRPWDSPGKNTGVGCHFFLQCVKVKSPSRVRLLATPWTAAYQAPPSMGFSRQECWSGVPLPSLLVIHKSGLPWWLSGEESACNARDPEDSGWIRELGRLPGGGHSNPLQYSCLKNLMDRGDLAAYSP